MITNNQIKFVKSLQQSKFRQKYNNFIAEGDKIAQEILQNSSFKIMHIFATKEWIEINAKIVSPFTPLVVEILPLDMSKISTLKTKTPILLVLEKRPELTDYEKLNSGHAIYLDDIQDPGNLGTIIRIADWFGVNTIVRSRGCADFYNPKVVQSTMGSFLNVSLFTEDFDNIVITQHKTVGAVMHGTSLSEFEWPSQTMLIMGNEGKGISSVIHQEIDHHVTIPGSDRRVADSLNVGMATGILLGSMFMNES
ncbi:MAG: TrmH family RNA methyltransferase [Saprospiraceae bacterium]